VEDLIGVFKNIIDYIQSDYRAQIAQLEQQVHSARQLADAKELEKVSSEDKAVRACLRITASRFDVLYCLYRAIWKFPLGRSIAT
jgi:hypothetical protein